MTKPIDTRAAEQTKDTASLRTGWYIGVVTAVAAGASKLFDWQIEVEDLLPFAPAAAVAAGVAYRAVIVVTGKFPWLGYIVFGNKQQPAGYVTPEQQNVAAAAVKQAVVENPQR